MIFISDIHLGCRNNSSDWLSIQHDYFYNWFIPLVKEQLKLDSNIAVFILGDLWDNRSSINIKVLNTALTIIEDLASIIDVHIICGNHDVFAKSSNNINALKVFNHIPNVKIYEEPELLNINSTKVFVMPWRATVEVEKECIGNLRADYLLCHIAYKGALQNKFVKSDEGNDKSIFSNFKKVYSGHIHYRQENSNIVLIGSPYEITRSDMGNKKGIYILDLSKQQHQFIENRYTPKFIKLNLLDLFDMSIKEFKKLVTNNFVDIITPTKWSTTFPFSSLLEITDKFRKINITVIADEQPEQESLIDDLNDLDLQHLTSQYINRLPYTPKVKKLVEDFISNLYQRVLYHGSETE